MSGPRISWCRHSPGNWSRANALARSSLLSPRTASSPEDDSTAYDISKGAIVMMTRTLAHSLAPHGIRVNGVAPGLIHTPLTAGLSERAPGNATALRKEDSVGPPRRTRRLCRRRRFPAFARGPYITGQMLVVDGGLTARTDRTNLNAMEYSRRAGHAVHPRRSRASSTRTFAACRRCATRTASSFGRT